MMGGAAPNWEENEKLFRLHGLGPAARPPGSDKALDLGCGCVAYRASVRACRVSFRGGATTDVSPIPTPIA